jgi:hypothetical protein
LYSPVGEFIIYAWPIGLILAAIVIAMVNWAPHGNADKAMAAFGGLVVVVSWAKVLFVVLVLVYPAYKIWRAADQTTITHHLFSKDDIELVRGSGTSMLRWTDITRAIETPKGVLVLSSEEDCCFSPAALPARKRGDRDHSKVRRHIRAKR